MKLKYYYFVLLSFALTLVACDDDPVLLKDPVSALSNDCIKRSLPVAPNIVGNEIEFAYAMAIPNELGKLSSAQVVSSIAGATGTYFDPNSYYTNSSGQDIPVKVCSDSQTNGTTTVIEYTYLDYSYESIPMEKAYSFNPVPEGLTDDQKSKVLGLGCQMWGEFIPTVESMNLKVYPRLAAYAETGWTDASNKDYQRFLDKLNSFLQKWKTEGITCGPVQ